MEATTAASTAATTAERPARTARRARRRVRRLTALTGAIALLTAGHTLAGTAEAGQNATAATAQVWITTADGGERLGRSDDAAFDSGPQGIDLRIDSSQQAQRFTGAGASMTGASARLISALPAERRRELMGALFSTDGDGIGLDYLRQPLAASDFVAELPFYTYEDTPGSFSVDRARGEIIPLLQQAREVNPGIRFMGTPWSPPAWMKDSGRLEGGSLTAGHYGEYADYLVRTLRAYTEAGIPIEDLTVQNEPLFETGYPSAHMSAAEQADFLRVLDGKLTEAGLGTSLFAYDHNWDHPEYPLEVLESTAGIERVRGAAFHCYGGQPEAQQQLRDAGERVLFTECSGTDSDDPSRTFADTLRWQTENLVIRSMRSGSETVVLWNLALDESGGPHFGNCAQKCNGVVEISGETVRRNAEFYVLGHVSRFVERGAHRIGSTTQGPGGVQNVTFENPDGSRASVVLNSSGSAQTFSITENGASLSYELPAGAVATFVWPQAPAG